MIDDEDLREKLDELEDGRFDAWFSSNKRTLEHDYCIEMHDDFADYCKMIFKEENE